MNGLDTLFGKGETVGIAEIEWILSCFALSWFCKTYLEQILIWKMSAQRQNAALSQWESFVGGKTATPATRNEQ